MNMKERYEAVCEFRARWPLAEFGPGHIVISDENVETEHVQWCLGILCAVQEARKVGIARYDEESFVFYAQHTDAELEATRLFLGELLSSHDEITVNLDGFDVTRRSWRDIAPE